jgi:hypothetical protein
MAKVKFGGMVADARGKHNGAVFSRSRFGALARAKVSPVQPRGHASSVVRSRLTGLSKRWATNLTVAQRAAWNGFAEQTPIRDVYGNSQRLSGIGAYQRVNGILLAAGQSRLDSPPTDLTVDYLTQLTGTFDVGFGDDMSVSWAPDPLPSDTGLYIFASAPMSPGRTFAKSFLRFLDASDDQATSPYDIKTKYTARFGTPPVGRVIHLHVALVKLTTGAVSSGVSVAITVISTEE